MNKSIVFGNMFNNLLKAEENIKDFFLLHKTTPQAVEFRLFCVPAEEVVSITRAMLILEMIKSSSISIVDLHIKPQDFCEGFLMNTIQI